MGRLGVWFTSARGESPADEEPASQADQQELATWANERSELVEAIRQVQKNRSWTADESGRSTDFELKPGEGVHAEFDADLVEPKRGANPPTDGYSGFSVRLTRSLAWRMDGSVSWYAPGPDDPRIVDSGNVTITDRRMVFVGRTRSREFPYSKLVDFRHLADAPITLVRLSNRATTSGIAYRGADAISFQLTLASAVAHATGTESHLVDALKAELAELDERRPMPPEASLEVLAAHDAYKPASRRGLSRYLRR